MSAPTTSPPEDTTIAEQKTNASPGTLTGSPVDTTPANAIRWGYARVSTRVQDHRLQLDALAGRTAAKWSPRPPAPAPNGRN